LAIPAHFSQFFGWSGTAQALVVIIAVPTARMPAIVACNTGFSGFMVVLL
jgi:hypothetical protein